MSTASDIEKQVRESVTEFVNHLLATEKSLVGALTPLAKIKVGINSSFLLRNKSYVKTTQSPRRILVELMSGKKNPIVADISIVDDLSFTQHYTISPRGGHVKSLSDAINEELKKIGDVSFILIGMVKGLRETDVQVDGEIVKSLRLKPGQSKPVEKNGSFEFTLSKMLPVEDLLEEIERLAKAGTLSPEERQKAAKAYDNLLDSAVTDVSIPTGKPPDPDQTILGRIAASLRDQADRYEKALEEYKKDSSDSQAKNEVLRIAYNFSTDALPLIFLLMSICDIKPLVFWCTIDKQWLLSKAFSSLPWFALGRKENLHDYKEIISSARNQTFHHVLPFETSISVDPDTVDIQADKLIFFPPYGKKGERGVHLVDQDILDLLTDFSHTKQRPVATKFWQQDLQVMRATYELVETTLEALIFINTARNTKKAKT